MKWNPFASRHSSQVATIRAQQAKAAQEAERQAHPPPQPTADRVSTLKQSNAEGPPSSYVMTRNVDLLNLTKPYHEQNTAYPLYGRAEAGKDSPLQAPGLPAGRSPWDNPEPERVPGNRRAHSKSTSESGPSAPANRPGGQPRNRAATLPAEPRNPPPGPTHQFTVANPGFEMPSHLTGSARNRGNDFVRLVNEGFTPHDAARQLGAGSGADVERLRGSQNQWTYRLNQGDRLTWTQEGGNITWKQAGGHT